MLNKIKQLFAILKIKPNSNIITPIINTVQEDTRDQETRKRVAKYFEDNHTLIMARGLRPHSYDCVDRDLCEKDPCWKFVPDKIVSKPYEVKKAKSKKLDTWNLVQNGEILFAEDK